MSFTFPNLSCGQSVVVDMGYALQTGEIVKMDGSSSDSQLGYLFLVNTAGYTEKAFARIELYSLPEELPRLERDMDARIGVLSYQVSRLKAEGSI